MNALNENLQFYGSYFHGVHDIIGFKSAKQVAFGALKILSGFTGIVPIIFAVGYLIAQNKLKNLENLCGRVSKALTSEVKGEQPTQNELIAFLSKVVLDSDSDNKNFEAGFSRLISSSQKKLFASMADNRLLVDALARVPKNMREITVSIGRNPPGEMIDQTIIQLCTFKQLHTATFDLSQTTRYTDDVQKLIKGSIARIEISKNFKSGGYSNSSTNDTPASRIIAGIVDKLIKESALAQINFCFMQEPGAPRSVSLANPSRLANIPEEDSKKAFESNPLNHLRPFPNAKDTWLIIT